MKTLAPVKSMGSSQWGTGNRGARFHHVPWYCLTLETATRMFLFLSPLTQIFLKFKIKCYRCNIKELETQRKPWPAPGSTHWRNCNTVWVETAGKTLPSARHAACQMPLPLGAREELRDTHRCLDQMEALDSTAAFEFSPDLTAKSYASLLVWRAWSDPERNPYST